MRVGNIDCSKFPEPYRSICDGSADVSESVRMEFLRDWSNDEAFMSSISREVVQKHPRDPLDDSPFLCDLPCRYRGEVIEIKESTRCGSSGIPFNVYSCEEHEKCTANYQCVELKFCSGCEDMSG